MPASCRKRFYTLFLAVVCTVITLYADDLNIPFIPPVYNYTTNHYRASNQNWAIAQGSDGVLYFGNDNGLLSFDGTNWKAVPSILHNLQDPALFIDDDGSAYVYWGSSNLHPIRGQRLDKDRRFIRYGEVDTLFNKDMEKHGWERFGENNSDTIPGYIEGRWMAGNGQR